MAGHCNRRYHNKDCCNYNVVLVYLIPLNNYINVVWKCYFYSWAYSFQKAMLNPQDNELYWLNLENVILVQYLGLNSGKLLNGWAYLAIIKFHTRVLLLVHCTYCHSGGWPPWPGWGRRCSEGRAWQGITRLTSVPRSSLWIPRRRLRSWSGGRWLGPQVTQQVWRQWVESPLYPAWKYNNHSEMTKTMKSNYIYAGYHH